MMRWIPYVCLVFFLAQASFAADEYTLKIKDKQKGDVVTVKRLNSTDESLVITEGGKTIFNHLERASENSTFWEQTLIKKPGKPATQLKRGYGEARYKNSDKAASRPYEGKLLLIEQKDDVFHFSIDGKELEEEEAEVLQDEFEHLDGISEWKQYLPTKPVIIDERWTIKPGAWLTYLEESAPAHLEVNGNRAIARGQLMKIYKKDGRLYGVIDLHFDIPVKTIKYSDVKLGNQSDRVLLTGSIEGCLDGSAHDLVIKKNWNIETSGKAADIGFRYVYRRTFEESTRAGAK